MVDFDVQLVIAGRFVITKLLPNGYEDCIYQLSCEITAAMDKVAELQMLSRSATSRKMTI